MRVDKEEKDRFFVFQLKSHGFIEVRYRLVILTELAVAFPLVQVGKCIVGFALKQLDIALQRFAILTNYQVEFVLARVVQRAYRINLEALSKLAMAFSY